MEFDTKLFINKTHQLLNLTVHWNGPLNPSLVSARVFVIFNLKSFSLIYSSKITFEMEEKELSFHKMELDDRILKGIAKLGWLKPTKIQEIAIPLILDGKDVLIRAKTGSGKTAAFVVPLLQKIIKSKQHDQEQKVSSLILAPTKELCDQILKVRFQFIIYLCVF